MYQDDHFVPIAPVAIRRFVVEQFLGIDIGKFECHAALLDEKRVGRKSFANNAKGFAQLDAWLQNRKANNNLRVCMESTGGWSEGLALHLAQAGHRVSVVNPSRIKAFAQSEMLRTKTDAVDAALIARFCRALDPELWTPPALEVRQLQALLRRLDTLEEMRLQEENRLGAPLVTDSVRRSVEEMIETLDRQIRAIESEIDDLFSDHPGLKRDRGLLTSIPGIGEKTAARILGELPDVSLFQNSKAVAAFAGLSPAHRQSGVDRRPSHLSKKGNSRLRRALYFPAIVGIQHNGPIRNMAERLSARGKPKMVIIGAAMRKLITIAYAVLRSGTPFNPILAGQSLD
jgi:transposase